MLIDNFYRGDFEFPWFSCEFPRVRSGILNLGGWPDGPRFLILSMRITGMLLLVAGWALVLSAVVLLRTVAPRAGFVAAGLGVEILGLVLVFRSHHIARGGKR